MISTSPSPAFGPSRSSSTISSGFFASNATAARVFMAVSFSHAQSGKERGNARCPILPVAKGRGEGGRREAVVEGQRRRAIAPPSAATPLPPPHSFATGRSDTGGRDRKRGGEGKS